MAICHGDTGTETLWHTLPFHFHGKKSCLSSIQKWTKNVFKLCTKISPGRSHFRARTNTMANQEKDLRNSKPLSKLIFVKPLLRNPGWKSMFLLMLNGGSTSKKARALPVFSFLIFERGNDIEICLLVNHPHG